MFQLLTKYLMRDNTNRGYRWCTNALLNKTRCSFWCCSCTLLVRDFQQSNAEKTSVKNSRRRRVLALPIAYMFRWLLVTSVKQVPCVLERLLAFSLKWLFTTLDSYNVWLSHIHMKRFFRHKFYYLNPFIFQFIILRAGISFMNYKNPSFMFSCFIVS